MTHIKYGMVCIVSHGHKHSYNGTNIRDYGKNIDVEVPTSSVPGIKSGTSELKINIIKENINEAVI